ncbi:hypothetical protein KIPB_015944, partial [Kipferlia bialata]
WPSVIRVSPVLFWDTVDVWDFLLRFRFEYCPLYDQGYTSLGSPSTTTPHPALTPKRPSRKTLPSVLASSPGPAIRHPITPPECNAHVCTIGLDVPQESRIADELLRRGVDMK